MSFKQKINDSFDDYGEISPFGGCKLIGVDSRNLNSFVEGYQCFKTIVHNKN